MPNWVTNRIVFHGDQENIDRVLQYIKGNGSKIDFNKIIPMPDNIYRGDLGKRERELYGSNNWYDWSVANWGTKWNILYSSTIQDELHMRLKQTTKRRRREKLLIGGWFGCRQTRWGTIPRLRVRVLRMTL